MLSVKNWINNQDDFKLKGIQVPEYDVCSLKQKGETQPVWIHIGAGNLYRTFHAEIADDLANANLLDSGVVVANMRSPFAIDEIYKPFNNDILMITMCCDGSLKKRILASTAKALFASQDNHQDWNTLKAYFQSPKLQMTTYTITEKGYALTDSSGVLTEDASFDIKNGPNCAKTPMGLTCALLLERFNAGKYPIAMLTTDNFSQNGLKFRGSVLTIANGWLENGYVDKDFLDYVSNENLVSFPWSMIDRITPNPSQEVAKLLKDEGFEDVDIIKTPGGTGFSSFANTEEAHYLVVEDSFPNGRPELDKAGVILSDRKTAELADIMKVTACLNPLHTCLAIFGCLLGYKRIWEEMQDEDLVCLIKHIAYDEDLPVVEDPKVINPKKFVEELLTRRLPNKSLPDAPQRIACDTSQKVPIRYGTTLNSYHDDPNKEVSKLTYIPLTIAGWMRYLLAVDDEGNKFEASSDPLLDELQDKLKEISIGCQDDELIHKALKPILSNKEIFTCDLYTFELGDKIESMFKMMIASIGSVRSTIQKYC